MYRKIVLQGSYKPARCSVFYKLPCIIIRITIGSLKACRGPVCRNPADQLRARQRVNADVCSPSTLTSAISPIHPFHSQPARNQPSWPLCTHTNTHSLPLHAHTHTHSTHTHIHTCLYTYANTHMHTRRHTQTRNNTHYTTNIPSPAPHRALPRPRSL